MKDGMKELIIYKYQADQIEDTLRIVANILDSRKKITCADRQICKSIEMIKKVLNENTIMTEKEKAKSLIEKYRPFMYCYVGSEMLSNTFNEREQINNAKLCAKMLIEEVITVQNKNWLSFKREKIIEYWQKVLTEVDKYVPNKEGGEND